MDGLKDQKYGISDTKLDIKSSLHLCPVIANIVGLLNGFF